MNTAERIFYLLDKIGMEQKEFAAKIGTTDKTVSTWRTGRTKSFQKYIPRIAEVLGTTVDYLLTGEKNLPSISEDRGQVQKLVDELNKIGINVDTLSESQITKIAKLAKTLFEE